MYNLLFRFCYAPGEEKDGKPQNCHFTTHHSSCSSICCRWLLWRTSLLFSTALYIMGTLLPLAQDSFPLACRRYKQQYSALQHFDKFHTSHNTQVISVWLKRYLEKAQRAQQADKKNWLFLLKGNNMHFISLPQLSQGWQLAGMSTGCSLKSLYTWVFWTNCNPVSDYKYIYKKTKCKILLKFLWQKRKIYIFTAKLQLARQHLCCRMWNFSRKRNQHKSWSTPRHWQELPFN